MCVKVPEYSIGLPATDEFDDVDVDLRAEEGHGAPGAKGAGADVGDIIVEVR